MSISGLRRFASAQRSLRVELIGGAVVVLAPVIAMALVGILLLAADSGRIQRHAQDARVPAKGIADALVALNHAEDAGFATLQGASARDTFAPAARGVDDQLRRLSVTATQQRAARATLASEWQAARAIVEAGSGDERTSSQRFAQSMGSAERTLGAILAVGSAKLGADLSDVVDRQRRDRLALLLIIPVGIALFTLVIVRLMRRTVRPIRRLQAAATRLQAGDLSHRVEPAGSAELQALARSFNDMTVAFDASRSALEHQARHDPLTGVGNRSLLEERTSHALVASRRNGGRVGLSFLDLDGFKLVNDTLGHAAGDDLLRQLAERVQDHARGADTVARVGGDEFALLVEFIVDDDAAVVTLAAIAERTLEGLAEPVTVDGLAVALSACLGVAVSRPGSTFAQLLRDADAAMYRAKQRGPGAYEFFREDMHEAASTRLQEIAALRGAIDAEQFVLRFQPLVELDDDRTLAVEALVRWEHPERGMVQPLNFIPLAEETGLIVPIGRWVLHEACRQAAHWDAEAPDHPPLRVGVNLSPRQLADPALIDDVRDALARSGLHAGRLVLEVTETALMGDLDASIRRLQELRDLGVSISMDDFGTGYSSLAYLRRLPLDAIKVARDFVVNIENSPPDRALVRGILEFGHGLGLSVVAEGIETPEQHARLRGMGCDVGQGFLYSWPVDAEAMAERLRCAQAPRGADLETGSSGPAPSRRAAALPEDVFGRHVSQVLRAIPSVSAQLFDTDLRWLAIEGEALIGTGWRANELVGRRVGEAMPAQRAAALELVLRAALAGRSRILEWPSVRGDRHLRLTIEPARDDDGRITGVLLIAQDGSEPAEVLADIVRRRLAAAGV